MAEFTGTLILLALTTFLWGTAWYLGRVFYDRKKENDEIIRLRRSLGIYDKHSYKERFRKLAGITDNPRQYVQNPPMPNGDFATIPSEYFEPKKEDPWTFNRDDKQLEFEPIISSAVNKNRRIHTSTTEFLVPENLSESEKQCLEEFYSKG
jgi:hypothetical protein